MKESFTFIKDTPKVSANGVYKMYSLFTDMILYGTVSNKINITISLTYY